MSENANNQSIYFKRPLFCQVDPVKIGELYFVKSGKLVLFDSTDLELCETVASAINGGITHALAELTGVDYMDIESAGAALSLDLLREAAGKLTTITIKWRDLTSALS